MSIDTENRPKVAIEELPVLSGKLHFLVGMVEIERKVWGKESFNIVSTTMEEALRDCMDIADRLLFRGLEETT